LDEGRQWQEHSVLDYQSLCQGDIFGSYMAQAYYQSQQESAGGSLQDRKVA